MLERRWLTNHGPRVLEFEERLRRFLGVRHCVLTCNGTVALGLTARACGLSGEVIVPAWTFVATAHALTWQGLTPVFCDVDPLTGGIDPESAARAITPRTSAIVGVHLWGRACRVEALQEIGKKNDLTVLFDAAHAFGCTRLGRMIGGFGRAEVFSFHATKVVNAFEGGAIATNDYEIAERVRRLRNFGFAGEDTVVGLGINAKMTEVSAVMGLASLDKFGDFVEANRRNWRAYLEDLSGLPGLRLLPHDERERNNYHYVVLFVEPDAGLDRDQLQAVLRAENVLARRYFYPGCDRAEPYRSRDGVEPLPATRRLAETTLCLPTGSVITPTDAHAVCAIVRTALRDPARVRRALEGAARD